MMHALRTTTDHRAIRNWVELRGGRPAQIRPQRTPEPGSGTLRISFPGEDGDEIEFIDWNRFFERFDQVHLAFVYQEQTPEGVPSFFFKFVSKNGE